MPGRNRLFILSESRSGSNWLVETLNNHHQIKMLKEIFQEKKSAHTLERIILTIFIQMKNILKAIFQIVIPNTMAVKYYFLKP
jgi:LPS sulfotransferase NodH